MFRRLYRHLWLPLYRRWAMRQMARPGVWHWGPLRLEVPVGVFHPGLFFSTPILLRFLQHIDFQQKIALDVGAGSGALALGAALSGAESWAVDVNPLAVETARRNATANGLTVTVLESDLFGALPPDLRFDYLLVNPPYYAQAASDVAERAFFAGENGTYFRRFFVEVRPHCHPNTRIWMVLSEDCDLPEIAQLAQQAGFNQRLAHQQKHWGERFDVLEFTPQTTNNQ